MFIKTNHTTIYSPNPELLNEFNHKLYLKGNIGYLNECNLTLTIDGIIERVMTILDIYPFNTLNFVIKLFKVQREVYRAYKELYGKTKASIFCSPAFMFRPNPKDPTHMEEKNIIHISVADTCIKVLSHELTHALIESWYGYKKMPNDAQHRECWHVEKEITT